MRLHLLNLLNPFLILISLILLLKVSQNIYKKVKSKKKERLKKKLEVLGERRAKGETT